MSYVKSESGLQELERLRAAAAEDFDGASSPHDHPETAVHHNRTLADALMPPPAKWKRSGEEEAMERDEDQRISERDVRTDYGVRTYQGQAKKGEKETFFCQLCKVCERLLQLLEVVQLYQSL